MKIQKTNIVCIFLLVLLMALGGCSANAESGTEKNPAGVRQTVIYNGMKASKEANRFKAEITLEDVIRGEAAEDVFAAAGGYASHHEELELEDDQEFLIARFTLTITEAAKDKMVELGQRDVNMFKLVSETGEAYDYFLQRRYVRGNLFEDASAETTQTGCLFYLVNKEDENPNIAFLPSVNNGIWFRTSLTDSDKNQVETPILVSDWLEGEKETDASYGGTLNAPLPIGEYGYLHCRSSYFGEYEIELRVDEIFRGSEAEEQMTRLDSYDSQRNLKENQEYLLVKLTVNAPSVDLIDDTFLDFYTGDLRLINSNTGQKYDFENSIDFMDNGVGAVLPGGSSEGWIGYVIDKNDASPMMYYRSQNDRMLYYKLDNSYELPDDKETYKSVIPETNPIRDTTLKKGDWNNPYAMGDTVKLDYNPSSQYADKSPFVGSFQVLEAYRGDVAKHFLEERLYTNYYREKYMEPVVLKLKVMVDSAEFGGADFNSNNYNIATGRGAIIGSFGRADTVPVKDGLQEVYPGGIAEGYVGFLVPKGIEHMEVAYGNIYDNVDSQWINLEFSEEPPAKSLDELEEEDWTSGVFSAAKKTYDADNLYFIKVEKGKVLNCRLNNTVFFEAGQKDSFDGTVAIVEYIVQAADKMDGVKVTLESDPENLAISEITEVDFTQADLDNIIQIFESPYSELTDEYGNLTWKNVKQSLEKNGYIIEGGDA